MLNSRLRPARLASRVVAVSPVMTPLPPAQAGNGILSFRDWRIGVNSKSQHRIHAGIAFLCAVAAAHAQPAPGSRAPLAEEVFKNVQVLKGTSVGEFMDIMSFFSASL